MHTRTPRRRLKQHTDTGVHISYAVLNTRMAFVQMRVLDVRDGEERTSAAAVCLFCGRSVR